MFNVNPTCTIEIDWKNYNEIFPHALSTTQNFSGSTSDLKELRNNKKLYNLAFDSGINMEEEIIEPLEECIFTCVCFESV